MTPADFESWLQNPQRRPLLMGVLNLTPDSFSDGGVHLDPRRAVDHALEMVADGAALIDVGGESTRPGSEGVPEDEQLRRLLPVVGAIRDSVEVAISVDTTRSRVAAAALDHGASIINDISAGRDDPVILTLAASRSAPIILMHMQGTPATMQINPTYSDVVGEVRAFLSDRARAAADVGVAAHRILLDPGFGFGKTLEHNLQLLRELREIASLPHPLVVGTSRKGFLGKLIGEPDPLKRTYATAASCAWSVTNGAAILRVHDIRPMHQVLQTLLPLTHPPPP